jgi:hypothetical protein
MQSSADDACHELFVLLIVSLLAILFIDVVQLLFKSTIGIEERHIYHLTVCL